MTFSTPTGPPQAALRPLAPDVNPSSLCRLQPQMGTRHRAVRAEAHSGHTAADTAVRATAEDALMPNAKQPTPAMMALVSRPPCRAAPTA